MNYLPLILGLCAFITISSQGNPLYYDNIGNKMCFNGAKSWQIGWYNDRKVMLNPKTAMANNPNWSAMVTLVGVADYKNVASIPVVLKLETDTMNDYFIAFNRAVGINADNVEADDEVTVVLTGNDGEKQSQSYLKATLLVGEQFAIGKFGGGARTCVIKLDSIDKSTSVWKANVRLSTSGTVSSTNISRGYSCSCLLLGIMIMIIVDDADVVFAIHYCSNTVNGTCCFRKINEICQLKLPPTVKPTSSKPTTKKPSSLKPTNVSC